LKEAAGPATPVLEGMINRRLETRHLKLSCYSCALSLRIDFFLVQLTTPLIPPTLTQNWLHT
jgi:hypothetical protein